MTKFGSLTDIWSYVFRYPVAIVIDSVNREDGAFLVCRIVSFQFGRTARGCKFDVLWVRVVVEVSVKEGAHSAGCRVCWGGSVRCRSRP